MARPQPRDNFSRRDWSWLRSFLPLGRRSMSPGLLHQPRCMDPQYNPITRARRLQSAFGGGLLVDRVFGIKALQRVIDMCGRQQFPGFSKPGFELDQ